MGILARIVAVAEELAPEWALKRAAARRRLDILNSGYSEHGASHRKKSMQGWVTSTGGPDSDIVENLETLRERSRDLFAGEGLARGALKTLRTNEIGYGLQLSASIDVAKLRLTPEEAQAWEDQVEREFAMWANTKSCDAQRRSTFGELQALARLSQLMSGDVFALLPLVPRTGERYDLRVQLLEADRVSDPPVKDSKADILGGVEVGDFGEPLAYHIADRHPGENFVGRLRLLKPPTWTRVPAFGGETGRPLVLHLMESERPGQRRGVPLLAPVIETFKQLSRYTQAEADAAVVAACFTAVITTPTPQQPIGLSIPKKDQVDTGDPEDVQIGPGSVVGLAAGEDIKELNPTRPNTGFDAFVVALCRQLGAGIGIPYEVLVKHFTSSYSASRGALLEFWKGVVVSRVWLAVNLCQPVYEQWLEEAVARGYIVAPGFFADPVIRAAWCGAEWHGPTQGQLDPKVEVEAASLRVENGFSTRTRETRELTGADYWANNSLRGREERARRDVGLVADNAPKPEFTPTAAEALFSVNEARAANGAEPEAGANGEKTVLERRLEIEAANAANLAKVAEAKKGETSQQEAA